MTKSVGTMRACAVRRVDVPVDVVWRVLTDHEGMSTWAPGIRVTLERRGSPAAGGVGAVRQVRAAGICIRELITVADPGTRLAYRCLSGLPLRDYSGEVGLTADGAGTTLTWVLSASIRSRGLFLLLDLYSRVFLRALCKASEREHRSSAATAAQNVEASMTAPGGAGDLSDPAIPSLAAAFQRTAARHPDRIALSTPDGETVLRWSGYAEQVQSLAGGLHALGVRRGDTLALMMLNRIEFYPVDTAALHLGAVPFSIYNTSSPAQIRALLEGAQPAVAVCDSAHARQLVAASSGSSVQHVICVDGEAPGTTSLAALAATAPDGFDFQSQWRSVGREDVATLIYTSGTTGEPKGVQLTHGNLLAQVAATNVFLDAGADDRVISFLPSAHIADRWAAHYLQLVNGTQVFPLADRTALLAAMTMVRPTMFGAVPQVWQKIRAGIESMAGADEAKRASWQQAIDLGRQYVRAREAGDVPSALGAAHAALESAVFASVRLSLGLDQARIVMSGAAPVPADVVEYFNAIGLPLIDGWGMSELSAMGAFMPADAPRVGSVGKPLPGLEARLGADGELLVRGPTVMKGYLGRDDLTAEVLDAQGWMHTGDVAEIDVDGYITIVDRKKELIVTAGGKNISPAGIEKRIRAASPMIAQAAVIGDGRPFLVALVVLDSDSAAAYAAAGGLAGDAAVLATQAGIIELVQRAVAVANEAVSEVEQVRKMVVLPEFWEPGSDVLTHTMKLRRRPIAQNYAAVIAALYALPREESVLRLDPVPASPVPASPVPASPVPASPVPAR